MGDFEPNRAWTSTFGARGPLRGGNDLSRETAIVTFAKQSRVLSVAGVAALCGGVVVTALTGSAAAATSTASHAAGYYIGGQGLVVPGVGQGLVARFGRSGLVRDANGTEHLVFLKPGGPNGDNARLTLKTHKAGANHWVTHTLPGRFDASSGQNDTKLEANLSANGKHVDVIVQACNGVYGESFPISATHLVAPTLVVKDKDCEDGTEGPGVADVTPTTGNHMALLMGDASSSSTTVTQFVETGTPGGKFTAETATFPDAANGGPFLLTYDPKTGDEVAVGQDYNSGAVLAWSRSTGGAWSDPATLATGTVLDGQPAYEPLSVTSNRGEFTVGLVKNVIKNAKHNGPGGVFTVTRSATGNWSAAARVGHSSTTDTNLEVVANPSNGHVHAVFTRTNPNSTTNGNGLIRETNVGDTWSSPKFITHQTGDIVQAITFAKNGHDVIGFTHS
jgi:hypothetical protein